MRLDCGCRKALSFDNVFIKPKRSALPSRDFTLERTLKFKHSKQEFTGVPIIAANMDHTGTFEMAKSLSSFGAMTAFNKFYTAEQYIEFYSHESPFYTWLSIGMGALDELESTVMSIRNTRPRYHPNICIDVANGYTQAFSEYVAQVRKKFPQSTIMAGNVASYEMTEQLIISGADIVKVGIGPGSVCTTRRVTGVGAPQLSAIDECADAAHGLGGMICADGGCRYPGDIAKAYAAGADFVMLGGMLAGHDECDGQLVYSDGSTYDSRKDYEDSCKAQVISGIQPHTEVLRDMTLWIKNMADPVGMTFHGMSSEAAQNQHYGGLKEYRAAEGKEVTVDYRGGVRDTMLDILGGLRSTMTYIGAQRLKDIPKCATLVVTNEQLNRSFD